MSMDISQTMEDYFISEKVWQAAVKYKLHIKDILLACGYTERIYDIKQF